MQTAYVLVSPCKDEAKYIEKTLRSIAQQTVKPAQWVIVDDGSRDRTAELADRLAAADPGRVRVVHHPTNLGYGAALRSGFAAARYPLVAFTDGDRQFRVADLAILFQPQDWLRLTPTIHAATPLGMGFGETRFASPLRSFRLLYIAKNLDAGLAEAVIRDRFEAKATREIDRSEVEERSFATWSMGFRNVSGREVAQLQDFGAFARESVGRDLSAHAASAFELLERFRVGVR